MPRPISTRANRRRKSSPTLVRNATRRRTDWLTARMPRHCRGLFARALHDEPRAGGGACRLRPGRSGARARRGRRARQGPKAGCRALRARGASVRGTEAEQSVRRGNQNRRPRSVPRPNRTRSLTANADIELGPATGPQPAYRRSGSGSQATAEKPPRLPMSRPGRSPERPSSRIQTPTSGRPADCQPKRRQRPAAGAATTSDSKPADASSPAKADRFRVTTFADSRHDRFQPKPGVL